VLSGDARDEGLVVVMGDRRYRVERPWGDPAPDSQLAALSQLAVDSHGRVYAFQRAGPPVVAFEPSGAFCAAWGQGLIADAHGIFIAADDRVFLVDRDAHQVLIFTTGGEPLGALGTRHAPRFQAPFNHPTGVAVANDGEIYVSDGYGNSAVHRFSAAGEHMTSWGRPGAGPGEFSTPHAIWIDRADRVLVADRENDRVQVFDRGGRFLEAWGDFYHPMAIAEDDRGMILVTDQIPRLSMLSPGGELVGRCRAVWNGAHGAACNARGDIFLAETNPSRITKLAVTATE
jgi:peptidylglycine monooxygenase